MTAKCQKTQRRFIEQITKHTTVLTQKYGMRKKQEEKQSTIIEPN